MAERRAVLSIILDAARARRDAAATARSLRDLDAQRRAADANAVSGNEDVGRSEDRRSRSTTARIAAGIRAARQSQQNAAAARQEAAAAARLAPLQERVAAAQDKASRAALSAARANEQQAAAQRRLSQIIQRYGQDSDQAANAQGRLRQATLASQAAHVRYTRALRDSSSEMERLNAAQDNNGNSTSRFTARLKSAASSADKFGNSVKNSALKIGAMAGPIGLLVSFIPTLIQGFSQLSAAATSLLGPLSQVGNLAMTLPQGFSILGGAIGTVIGAFSGIGAAVKAGAQAQKQAGTDAKASAQKQKQAARQIADAAKAEQKALQGVKDAQKGVQDAREQAAQNARDAAAAVKQADQGVTDAEWNLYNATKQVTQARKDAAKQIDDMKDSLRDLTLQERGSSLSLKEAQENLNKVLLDPASSNLEKQQAQLAVDQAQAQLDSVRKQKKSAQADLKDAQAKGIEGSDQVVQAVENEVEAQRAVRDAQTQAAQARRDQAKSAKDSAEQIAQAQRAVKDAQDAARDAAQNLADAQADANDAMSEGSTSATAYQQALNDLSPAGKRFVALLLSMQSQVKKLKFAAQEGLLPGVGEGLVKLTKLVPLASSGLFKMGQIMGSTFSQAAGVLTSPEFMPVWNRLLTSNLKVMQTLSPAAINLVKALGYILDAYRPLTEWLAKGAAALSVNVMQWAKAKQQATLAGNSFAGTKDTLSTLWAILVNLGKTLGHVGKAGQDLGSDLLHSFADITKGWADWTGSVKGQNALKDWFDSARPAMHEAKVLIADVAKMLSRVSKATGDAGFADLLKAIDGILPQIEAFLTALGEADLDQSLVQLLGSLLEVLTPLAQAGILSTVADMLSAVASALGEILQYKAVQGIVKALAIGFAVIAALKFVGAITGISKMFNLLKRSGPMWERLFPNSALVRRLSRGGENGLRTAGQNMADALGRGWNSRIKPVLRQVGTGIDQVIDTAKRRLGIHSPSTVFIKIGENIGDGLAIGLTGSEPKVDRATEELVGSAVATGKAEAAAGSAAVAEEVAAGASGTGVSTTATKTSKKTKGKAKTKKVKRKGKKGAASAVGVADAPQQEKAAKSSGKLGKAATGAAGGVAALADGLSMVPGPVGDVANKFLMLASIIGPITPLFSKLGAGIVKALSKVGPFLTKFIGGFVKLVGKIGPLLMKLVGVVGKAMMLIGRAMLANPWMLLIAALIIIVVLVIKYWDQIKAAVMAAMNWIYDKVLKPVGAFFMKWLVQPIIDAALAVARWFKAIWNGIVSVVSTILGWVKSHWMLLLGILGGPIALAIVLIIKYWGSIKKAFSAAIHWIVNNLVKPVWGLLKTLLTAPVNLAWAALKKIWSGLKTLFKDSVAAIKWIFSKTWAGFKWLILDPIKWAWDKVSGVMSLMHKGLSKAADKIKGVFTNLKSGIGTIWSKVTDVIKAPIRLAVSAINKLIGGYNKIAKKVPGVGTLSTIKLGFAKGGVAPRPGGTEGVFPGYTPGRDIGYVGISGGEAIMRPEWTRAIGVSAVNEMNRVARRGGASELRRRFMGGFASGGVAGLGSGIPASGSVSAHPHSQYPWTRWAGDINQPGRQDYGNPVRAYKDGTVAGSYYIGNRSYGRYIRINHPGGERTLYAHLSKSRVQGGQKVRRGSLIGNVGDLGNVTGPHLHFEIAGGSDPITVGANGDVKAKPTLMDTMRDLFGKGIHSVSQGFANLIGGIRDKIPDGALVKGVVDYAKNGLSKAGQSLAKRITSAAVSLWNKASSFLGFGDDDAGASGSVGQQVKRVAAKYGWASGSEWGALKALINSESSFNPHAQNPTSTAYGLFQFLNSTWAAYGGHKTSDPTLQTEYGLRYIKQRYRTPINAWAFHRAHNWYSDGGVAQYASGGKVPGVGYRDTVPAMLTPGEFVIRKEAVRRIGVSRLEKLNGGKGGGGTGPVQHFHTGGPVMGMMKRGAKGTWVKALEYLTGELPANGLWGTTIDARLKPNTSYITTPAYKRGIPKASKDQSFINWLMATRVRKEKQFRHYTVPKGGELLGDILKHYYGGRAKTTLGTFLAANKRFRGSNAWNFNTKMPAGRYLSVPSVTTWTGYKTWDQASKHAHLNYPQMAYWMLRVLPKLRKQHNSTEGKAKRTGIENGFHAQSANMVAAFAALNKILHLPQTANPWPGLTANTQKALKHVREHAYGIKHSDVEYRPWSAWTPAEAALITQQQANTRQQNFQNALVKIASWGYEALLTDLQSKGYDDDAAYNTALDAAKKQSVAKSLNDALAAATAFTDEDLSNILKIISFLMGQTKVQGLRDVARHLGLSDYDTVKLWETGIKYGKFNSVPATKQSRMNADVASYRKGTFYANTGGSVPGSGNGDTVPAMLTPGEFVLRKKAAAALGFNTLTALNNADKAGITFAKFAAGGLVGSITPVPTSARAGVSARALANGGIVYNINNNWDIDINNPIAEKSSKSLTKALQRQTALGAPGGTVKKEG